MELDDADEPSFVERSSSEHNGGESPCDQLAITLASTPNVRRRCASTGDPTVLESQRCEETEVALVGSSPCRETQHQCANPNGVNKWVPGFRHCFG